MDCKSYFIGQVCEMVLLSSWSKEDKPRDTFYPNQNSVCFLYIVLFVVVYRTRGYLVMMMIATQIQYIWIRDFFVKTLFETFYNQEN